MLNPWNNSVAERLWITLVVFGRAAPHHHEIPVVSSVRSVGPFSTEQLQCWFCERIGEDMCNVCERMSCWVRASLICASSLPLPLSHPPFLSVSATLFSHFPSLMSFCLCDVSRFVFYTQTRQPKRTLYAQCLTQVQTHTHAICLPASLSFSILFPPLFSHPQSIIQMSNAFSLL